MGNSRPTWWSLRLRDHFDEIEQVNRVVLHEARYGGEKSPPAMLEGIQNFYVTELVGYTKSYPGLVITLLSGGRDALVSVWMAGPRKIPPPCRVG